MTIIFDSLEKKPYWEAGRLCKRQRLNVGDYTTKELLGIYHIERKSLQDLYGTLTKGKIRFYNEILRAKRAGIKLDIVVEGSYADFYNKRWPHGHERDCPSEKLQERIRNVERLGAEIFWCSSRAAAKHKIKKMLEKKEKLYAE